MPHPGISFPARHHISTSAKYRHRGAWYGRTVKEFVSSFYFL